MLMWLCYGNFTDRHIDICVLAVTAVTTECIKSVT